MVVVNFHAVAALIVPSFKASKEERPTRTVWSKQRILRRIEQAVVQNFQNN